MNAGATVDLPGHDGSGVLHVAAGATPKSWQKVWKFRFQTMIPIFGCQNLKEKCQYEIRRVQNARIRRAQKHCCLTASILMSMWHEMMIFDDFPICEGG